MTDAQTHAAVPPASPLLAVGVCTFRRPILLRTLESLAVQTVAQDTACCVIVADNDDTPSAQALVDAVRDSFPFPLHYVHAPARNISVARNAVLEKAAALGAGFLAKIDDDEIATPDWAKALLSQIRRSGADAVLGPVLATYRPQAPGWLQRARLHDVYPVIQPDGRILTGYTGNVILHLASPALQDRRFDLAYGRTGGEDDAFFRGLVQAGGRIGYAPEAIAYEEVPPARESVRFQLRRAFRAGQTHARILAADRETRPLVLFGKAAVKTTLLLGWAGLSLLSPARRTRSLMRAALQAGVCSQLLGSNILELYRA
ncbi:MAG: glycosyltransferase [Rhodobacteraceae bacterium]|nr:glycosyltransferase [Paracoccaceae bacterium]